MNEFHYEHFLCSSIRRTLFPESTTQSNLESKRMNKMNFLITLNLLVVVIFVESRRIQVPPQESPARHIDEDPESSLNHLLQSKSVFLYSSILTFQRRFLRFGRRKQVRRRWRRRRRRRSGSPGDVSGKNRREENEDESERTHWRWKRLGFEWTLGKSNRRENERRSDEN